MAESTKSLRQEMIELALQHGVPAHIRDIALRRLDQDLARAPRMRNSQRYILRKDNANPQSVEPHADTTRD